ncbi:hypothetical protein AT984_20760 [Paucibacter sp. KCTC 42545]|nr:hypothetical protein AT984_20760 [Paucibacter sp. KCTC 42545]
MESSPAAEVGEFAERVMQRSHFTKDAGNGKGPFERWPNLQRQQSLRISHTRACDPLIDTLTKL